jgi:uncharacterized protein (TIGR00369 family)
MKPMTNEELKDSMNSKVPMTSVLLGAHIEAVDQELGTIRIRYLAKPEFCNPMGSVQGGIVAAMLDDTSSFACIVKAKGRISVPTLEFKVSFLAPAKPGILFTEGRVEKFGRTISFLEAELFDDAGKLLARMSATCMHVARPETAILVDRNS